LYSTVVALLVLLLSVSSPSVVASGTNDDGNLNRHRNQDSPTRLRQVSSVHQDTTVEKLGHNRRLRRVAGRQKLADYLNDRERQQQEEDVTSTATLSLRTSLSMSMSMSMSMASSSLSPSSAPPSIGDSDVAGNGNSNDGDGDCPADYSALPMNSCQFYPLNTVCNYDYEYDGCTWDDLQCSWISQCECMEDGALLFGGNPPSDGTPVLPIWVCMSFARVRCPEETTPPDLPRGPCDPDQPITRPTTTTTTTTTTNP